MQIIKGGYSFVEFDTVATFVNPKRIDRLLKAGTGFTPKTLTEEFADNMPASAGKALDLTIRSANVDNAVGSVYALLKGYEEARTPIYFRFVKVLGEVLVIEDCEDAWDESADANITSAVDAADKKDGTNSVKLTAIGVVADEAVLATEVINNDLTTYKAITCWIKSSVAKVAGSYSLLLDNTANCASPLSILPFPALDAGVWTRCILVLLDPSLLASVASIGIKSTGLAGGEIIHLDDVRASTGYISIINKVIPKVTFEKNEAGKHNAIKIVGEGFADSEANLLTNIF